MSAQAILNGGFDKDYFDNFYFGPSYMRRNRPQSRPRRSVVDQHQQQQQNQDAFEHRVRVRAYFLWLDGNSQCADTNYYRALQIEKQMKKPSTLDAITSL